MKTVSNRLFWIFGILLACFLILLPLFRPGFIQSDDGDWMVIRLSAFYQSLREGQFPVRFLGRLNFSYGYPVANFLYPGFLYLGSVIHLLGFTFADTVKLIFILAVISTAIIIFYWLRIYFDPLSSFLGTLGFVFGPYLFFDIYKRGSIGEVLSLLPAALTLYALETKKYLLLPFSTAFLVLSHNSLAIFFLFLFICFIIYRKAMPALNYILLGIGIAAFFWIPALYEKRYVIFDSLSISDPSQYFIKFPLWFLLHPAALVASLFLLYRRSKLKKNIPTLNYVLFVFLLSTILSLPISSPLWNIRLFGAFFQFPYRFLAAGLLVSPYLIAYYLSTEKLRFLHIALLILAFYLPIFAQIPMVKIVDRSEGFFTTNEATTTVLDEYMPKWVLEKPKERVYSRLEFHEGRGVITPLKISTQKISVQIRAYDNSIVQINTIYYPGWGATLNGEVLPLTHDNPYGVMRGRIPAGTHTLSVEFHETFERFLADVITLVSLLIYGGLLLQSLKINPKKRI